MADRVTVDISKLHDVLRVMVERGGNLRGAMPGIADIMVTAVDDELTSEGRGRWPPLAPETLARRRKEGRGAKMLQDTGLLAQIQPRTGPDWAEVFSPAPYAIFHTSDAPRKIIPKRDFLDIETDETMEEIQDYILDAILGT